MQLLDTGAAGRARLARGGLRRKELRAAADGKTLDTAAIDKVVGAAHAAVGSTKTQPAQCSGIRNRFQKRRGREGVCLGIERRRSARLFRQPALQLVVVQQLRWQELQRGQPASLRSKALYTTSMPPAPSFARIL
jgi:hypothetical protein